MNKMQFPEPTSFAKFSFFSLVFSILLISNRSQELHDATLIPLTIFDQEQSWNAAVQSCYQDFGVRLAISGFSLRHLKHVVEEDVEEAKVSFVGFGSICSM